jgi:hypothetical protein
VQVSQHGVKIAIRILDSREVKLLNYKKDENVVQEVFRYRVVTASEVKGPTQQSVVVVDEKCFRAGGFFYAKIQHHVYLGIRLFMWTF